jgi:hypothetical protein
MAWEPEVQGTTKRTSRGLSTRMKVFIVVDALLLVALLVFVISLSGSDSGSSPSASGARSTTPSAAATPGQTASTGAAANLGSFALPSGNIACTITDKGATCTIASITFAPPPAGTCKGTVGHVFTVGPDGASVPCTEGPAPVVAGSDVPVLEYGRVASVSGYTCESSTSGVTCRNDSTKKGFTLARGSFSLQN